MSKGTPRRSVRIPDETWDAALELANEFTDPSGRAADAILTAGYIRIPAELWAAVKAKAAQQNTTASETIRALLTEWVKES